MLLKIALNGARSKSENESIPQTTADIVKNVRSIFQAGFRVFHIHCFDEHGNESLQPKDVSMPVSSIKNISPQIRIGISTGDWIEPDLLRRLKCIENWNTVPDFCSVNMIEENALHIAKALMEKGVLIEAGLNEKKAAEIFVNSELNEKCIRVLIEPEAEDLGEALHAIAEIEDVLDKNNNTVKRLLHGFNETAWPILRQAKIKGYDSRTGFEDTIFLENGVMATSNLELIEAATRIIDDPASRRKLG